MNFMKNVFAEMKMFLAIKKAITQRYFCCDPNDNYFCSDVFVMDTLIQTVFDLILK